LNNNQLSPELAALNPSLPKVKVLITQFSSSLIDFKEPCPVLESGLSIDYENLEQKITKNLNNMKSVMLEHYTEIMIQLNRKLTKRDSEVPDSVSTEAYQANPVSRNSC
jgi:hypothetical protein